MEKKDSVMLTVDEVASYLRLHPLTVRCLARQGNIPADIEPARFQFINSPLTLALCQRYDDLREWATSIAQSVETGAVQSLSFPITSYADDAVTRPEMVNCGRLPGPPPVMNFEPRSAKVVRTSFASEYRNLV